MTKVFFFRYSLKCDHPFLCKFPILFSTVRFKLAYILSQFIHRSKCVFWNVGLGLCILPSFSQFIKVVDCDFWKASRLHYQIFPNSLKCLKIRIFEVPLPSYFCQTVKKVFQYDMWRKRRGANLWLNYQVLSKNVYIIMQVTILYQIRVGNTVSKHRWVL